MDQSVRSWGSLLRRDHFCGRTCPLHTSSPIALYRKVRRPCFKALWFNNQNNSIISLHGAFSERCPLDNRFVPKQRWLPPITIKSGDHRPISVVSFVAQIADVIEHARPLQHVSQSDLGNDGLIVISYVLCKIIFTGCFVKDSSSC